MRRAKRYVSKRQGQTFGEPRGEVGAIPRLFSTKIAWQRKPLWERWIVRVKGVAQAQLEIHMLGRN